MPEYIGPMGLANGQAIEYLRTDVAQWRLELSRLLRLAEHGASLEIQRGAATDLELVTGRIRNLLNELSRLEAR